MMDDGRTKSPLNLVGLAAAGEDGMNKGRLTVDGEARIANHVLPPFADLHRTSLLWGKKLVFDNAEIIVIQL